MAPWRDQEDVPKVQGNPRLSTNHDVHQPSVQEALQSQTDPSPDDSTKPKIFYSSIERLLYEDELCQHRRQHLEPRLYSGPAQSEMGDGHHAPALRSWEQGLFECHQRPVRRVCRGL